MPTPTTVEEELLLSKREDGLILVDDVLERAEEHRDWPVAKQLQWNNEKAGHEYRKIQIRHLISLHIRYEDGERRVISLSIDRTKPQGGYRNLEEVVDQPSLYRVALMDALAELDRVRARFKYLQELGPVWMRVDEIRADLKKRKDGGGDETGAVA